MARILFFIVFYHIYWNPEHAMVFPTVRCPRPMPKDPRKNAIMPMLNDSPNPEGGFSCLAAPFGRTICFIVSIFASVAENSGS